MKKNLLLYVAIIFLVINPFSVCFGKNYLIEITIDHHPQISKYVCGVAVAEMWLHHLFRFNYVTQQQIIEDNKKWLLFNSHTNGIKAGELKEILEKYTQKEFSVNDHKTEKSAIDRIVKELKKDKHPLAISGNACLPDGTPKKSQGHWLLVSGLKLGKKDKFEAVFINDPLYGSKYANEYEAIRPRTWVRDLFRKWWLPNPKKKNISKQYRQSVED